MINQSQANEAREQILNFIIELRNHVEETIYKPYGDNGELLVLEEMQKELSEAFRDFSNDFNLDRVKERLFETTGEALQSHGLYGNQLRAKLSLFRLRIQNFFSNRGKKTLLKWIDAADTLLDSVLAATGIDEALKELKDLLRNSIDD